MAHKMRMHFGRMQGGPKGRATQRSVASHKMRMHFGRMQGGLEETRSESFAAMRDRARLIAVSKYRKTSLRRNGRVAEGAPLLRAYTLIAYRGFESLFLRHALEPQ